MMICLLQVCLRWSHGWMGGGPAMQCHILAMVLAVTLDLSGVQEHCKLNNNNNYKLTINIFSHKL